jgi:hypothetical protein
MLKMVTCALHNAYVPSHAIKSFVGIGLTAYSAWSCARRSALGVEPADETRAYLEFLIPQSLASQLPGFLRELEARSQELGISDVQLSLTSLEEVFLTIARKVCLQAV